MQGFYSHTGQHKQNKYTQISMPQAGFEPMITAFELVRSVYGLVRAAAVISILIILIY
jgi:hypothetical protein